MAGENGAGETHRVTGNARRPAESLGHKGLLTLVHPPPVLPANLVPALHMRVRPFLEGRQSAKCLCNVATFP